MNAARRKRAVAYGVPDTLLSVLLVVVALLLLASTSACGHTLGGTVGAARQALSGAAYAGEKAAPAYAALLDEARVYCEQDLGIKAGTPEAAECMAPLGDGSAFVEAADKFKASYDKAADALAEMENLGHKMDKLLEEARGR